MREAMAASPYAGPVSGYTREVMAQPQPTRLREVDPAPVDDAKVIDAQFRVVGRKTRAIRIMWGALVAVFWAALIGFLIPPAWIFFEGIGEYFAAAN